ncbi:MAG: tandem-95 repeat protein [Planctomycetales bacterium]|nr:tandem-95 repeat protein [Planctomycetales bacterium]
MKKQIGKMLTGFKSSRRLRKDRLRKLRLESLEGRRLLASDLAANPTPYHNPLIDADVNADFNIAPNDALAVINALNRDGAGKLSSDWVDPQGKLFIDVDGDGYLAPIDALLVVNRLNGEGETDPLVTYTAEVTDLSGNPITQVVVGQSFRLNVFVQDTRPTGPTGVFQNAIDVGVENSNLITFPLGAGSVISNLTFGSLYQNGRRASLGANPIEDFLDEVNSFSTGTTPPDPPGGVYLFFSADMRADAAGTVNFILNQHENEPTSQVNVFDQSQTLPDNGRIDPSMIMYGTDSIQIIVDPTSPVAMNDTVSTPEDTALLLVGGSVDLTTNDAREAGRTLSVVSISSIAGTTQGTINGFTYTPPLNFFGQDTLTYTIEDSNALRSTATVTINVTPVNDAPVAVDDSLAVDEETTDNFLDVLLNDTVGPANETSDSIIITSVSTPTAGGSLSIAADGKSLIYTPDPTFIGDDTFTYTIMDSGGLTDTATVTVAVEATVLPRARTDRATVLEDSMDNIIDVLLNDRTNAGATKILVGIDSNPANGSVTIDTMGTSDSADDVVLYTPNSNFFGTDTFTYSMNDTATGSLASIGTVTVTVTGVNDPVQLVNDMASATEDTPATIAISTLLSNDSPGPNETAQTLTLTAVNAVGSGGMVAISGNNVIYTPAADFNGTFLFTYTAQDNGTPSESATATVTVIVDPVNDNPIANPDTANAVEDTAAMYQTIAFTSNDAAGPANESTQELSIVAVSASSAAGGTVALAGTTVTYTPPTDFNGTDTFTYTLSDGQGGTATGTVTVSVAAVNDAPTAVADTVRAFKDNPLNIPAADLLANDLKGPANESSQTLTIVSVAATANTNGTVVLNSDGSVTYTPTAGYTGPASFDYTIQDNGGGTNSSTGTVNVTVEEFVPSVISGFVWVDENNDGEIDNTGPKFERRVGGVPVTLTGTSLGQAITPQTMMTLADGSYSFENLGPGQYVISYATPTFLIDGKDVAGALGDADSVENQFTLNIATPGGANATDYNFGVLGVQSTRARILDQLASSYSNGNPGLVYNGGYFGLASDNSLMFGTLLDGFDGTKFAEAVLSADGSQLLLTVVDSSNTIRTTVLGRGEFFVSRDTDGNALVRVLGSAAHFDWQIVNLGTPSIISATKYLDAVDAIFSQEGW